MSLNGFLRNDKNWLWTWPAVKFGMLAWFHLKWLVSKSCMAFFILKTRSTQTHICFGVKSFCCIFRLITYFFLCFQACPTHGQQHCSPHHHHHHPACIRPKQQGSLSSSSLGHFQSERESRTDQDVVCGLATAINIFVCVFEIICLVHGCLCYFSPRQERERGKEWVCTFALTIWLLCRLNF